MYLWSPVRSGIPFTGIVVEPDGTPVDVGNPVVTTGADGRFQTRVNKAERYVVNVRKKGYALNSQIYDRSVTGGRWTGRSVTRFPASGGSRDPEMPGLFLLS